jgi:uncharacterized protein YaeQ
VAIKPTIFKLQIFLSDVDRNYYDCLNLTVAQHPSETRERMMARVVAYCLNAQERLTFSRGISATDEPDIWLHTLDGRLVLWIDVGEPTAERIKKASHIAERVNVYSFNTKSDVWWEQGRSRFAELSAAVYRFDWESIKTLADLVQRTMDMSFTITGESAYVATNQGECEVSWTTLQSV